MKALRLRMIGKQDVNKEDYYFTTTHVPAFIDLNRAVIHFYPDEEGDGSSFGGELVIRHYDPRIRANVMGKVARRRRRNNDTDEDLHSEELDQEDGDAEGSSEDITE